MYEDAATNPSISKEQKEHHASRMQEKPQRPEPKPTISFEYNQPNKPPNPGAAEKAQAQTQYMPYYAPNPLAMGITPGMMYNPYGSQPMINSNAPVIVNKYSISTNGPTGDHSKIGYIYEDTLPSKQFSAAYDSIGERLNLLLFIRASIYNNTDGTNTSLTGDGENSLLSHIKFNELNPYNSYRFSSNPYMGLPEGYLIYRSCYPIRHVPENSNVACAKDSTAVNIRIYKLVEGAYLINRISPDLFYEFDAWREIAYYEHVRENIIKHKLCPHFVTAYGYHISEKSGVDYDKIKTLSSKNNVDIEEPIWMAFDQNSNQDYDIVNGKLISISPTNITYRGTNNTVFQVNPNSYRGKSLVIMTESPTFTLFNWASLTYELNGNIKQMVNRGVHTSIEWKNILFQLIIALYAMQKHEIIINDFSISTNVFIKDLITKGPITQYWKYIINGIDYYLPNLGYLLLIDSNYSDLGTTNGTTTGSNTGGITMGNRQPQHNPLFPPAQQMNIAPNITAPPIINQSVTLTPELINQLPASTVHGVARAEQPLALYNNVVQTPEENEQRLQYYAAMNAMQNTQIDQHGQHRAPNIIPGNKPHKIEGSFLNTNLTPQQIKEKTFKMFRSVFDQNIFTNDFTNYGGRKPPADILALINQISAEANNDTNHDIGIYIEKYMRMYMNNRIGTHLKEGEITSIREAESGVFKKGQMVVYEENGDKKFAMYLGVDQGQGQGFGQDKAVIITKNDPQNADKINQTINKTSLSHYSKAEPIAQVYKLNEANLNEDDLIETYIM
jgi:hypothetical protein